jgi:hypothetical protein
MRKLKGSQPILFAPKLGLYGAKLVELAKLAKKRFVSEQDPDRRLSAFQELRQQACQYQSSPSLGQLKLMVAQNALLDLVAQGWTISIRSDRIKLHPNGDDSSKDVIRQRHLLERDAQLREKSVAEFIHNMERRTLTAKGWQSIYSVMRDGSDLARSIQRLSQSSEPFSLATVIDPYIQFVEPRVRCAQTGLLLSDIWRYFRHTWVTSYKSVPGRSLSILIRDRATTGHPVIGIAALSSSVVQQSVRDQWIGWDAKTVVQRLQNNTDARFIRKLVRHLNRRIAEIYKSDLINKGLVSRSEIQRPSDKAISRLRTQAKKSMQLHRKHPEASVHKRVLDTNASWRHMAEMHLFRAKRCRELASLLQIRQTLINHRLHRANGKKLAEALNSSAVRTALAQIIRFLKAENVGVHMMDITVCGAIAPYNALLGGKLVCTLLCSPELTQRYRHRYKDQTSIIASAIRGKRVSKVPKLVLLCTTSLYGNGSSQYNRLKIPIGKAILEYQELGSSEGFGSFHIGKETIRLIDVLLGRAAQGRKVNSIFGEGVNPLMRKIREALDMLGLPSTPFLRHGNKRIVYGVSLASNFREVLCGLDSKPKYLIPQKSPALQTQALYRHWSNRWLLNRMANPEILASVATHTLAYPVRHGAQAPIKRPEESFRAFATAVS